MVHSFKDKNWHPNMSHIYEKNLPKLLPEDPDFNPEY